MVNEKLNVKYYASKNYKIVCVEGCYHIKNIKERLQQRPVLNELGVVVCFLLRLLT